MAPATRPNLIKELGVDRSDQVRVADITYWFTHYGCLHISLITDAYSKRIMGYGVAPTLQAVHCKAALQMALEQLNQAEGKALVHHSDRGIQYCSAEYVGLLDSYQIRISMTENGDPLGNAIAERINGHRGAESSRTNTWIINRLPHWLKPRKLSNKPYTSTTTSVFT